jgi:uncharacterized protein YeaO (DUF488 family)
MPVHTKAGTLAIKRIYDQPEQRDGIRVLVDRLWPRGVSKERARVDLWLKDLGPSTGLRKWFGHEPSRFAEFTKRYIAEIEENQELVAQIRALLAKSDVTLLFGARDSEHNNALVIRDYIVS